MYNKIVAYASAIRAADPAAKIVGPEEWSWWAMYSSGFDQANGSSAANSDYNTHGQTYYYPWLLQQLYAYKQQTGTQLHRRPDGPLLQRRSQRQRRFSLRAAVPQSGNTHPVGPDLPGSFLVWRHRHQRPRHQLDSHHEGDGEPVLSRPRDRLHGI